jgi:hypothetical protein
MTTVKIYREPENESLIINEEELREYNELVSELGIIPVEQKNETKCPNVYVCLNRAMAKQMKALCPLETAVEHYTRSTIPVEVLRVLKYAKEHEMFDGYYIWCDDTKPDPLLIGWKYSNENSRINKYDWNQQRYLLARWGDCALELPELLQLGFQRIKQEVEDKAREAIIQCNNLLVSPDMYVRRILEGQTPDISLRTSADNI